MTSRRSGTSRASRRSVRSSSAAVLGLVLLLGACSSGEDDAGSAALGGAAAGAAVTTTVAPGADASASTAVPATDPATGAGSTAAPAPDTTAPPVTNPAVDGLPPASTGLPEVLPVNSKEEPIALDETALLACANNQIAWVELQQDNDQGASDYLRRAAERARVSAVAEIAEAAPSLEKAAGNRDRATIDAFLELCTSRGFEY